MNDLFFDMDMTLLSLEDYFGPNKSVTIEKYGNIAGITDLAILRGAYCEDSCTYLAPDIDGLKGRTGWFYTLSSDGSGDIQTIRFTGEKGSQYRYRRHGTVRPVLISPSLLEKLKANKRIGTTGAYEVDYGEYPQYAVSDEEQKELEELFENDSLSTTGKQYTFDSANYNDTETEFDPDVYEEYDYNGRKFVRVIANSDYGKNKQFSLSNLSSCKDGDAVWLEVSPVTWLIDERKGYLISKVGLISGLRFESKDIVYNGDFSNTEMKRFFNNYMMKEMFSKRLEELTPEELDSIEKEKLRAIKRKNPYGFDFNAVSEEDIIHGAINSDVAVFLHGASSEGKSARVLQIDPDCEIIYLRNASPESLNGKCVYNQKTGEMMDVPPTWLKKVQKKCEKDPNHPHIVFFDEITNALPSIQGIAFNIVLNREVNGIWKLPPNAKIVAAGNDMKESLAANQLAEPLFNRFAHVYIKTTTRAWLKWASEHNIHPAIYAYIAYKNGEPLRSQYTGEKPNADPRKWEMASKILYKTGNPEMLRSLVGEEITREFVEFCTEPVITLDRVLNGDYTDSEVHNLNTAGRYATAMNLTQVSEQHLEEVRNFVKKLGSEFVAVFDSLWARGDEKRLEKIAEARLIELMDGGAKK